MVRPVRRRRLGSQFSLIRSMTRQPRTVPQCVCLFLAPLESCCTPPLCRRAAASVILALRPINFSISCRCAAGALAGASAWPARQREFPYSSTSAFAGNPLLISLERLAEHGWIDPSRLGGLSEGVGAIEYDQVQRHKLPLLIEAARNFLEDAPIGAQLRFQHFCTENAWWLEDFVLFDALRDRYGNTRWSQWPRELARREPEALLAAGSELGPELAVRRAMQFAFYEQWHALRLRCAQRSIRVVGDIAIFVDYDSADVWAHRDLYRLKEDLEPEVVSGVPPDAFSATGQRWGNPLYNWQAMQSRGYRWWIQRLRWATQTCDYIRLDHFRGFEQFWEIPASEPTAMRGRWVDGPKDELFNKLREALGGLPFFAEDLGYITPEVHALRERHQIPGLAVLQFGFGNPGAHIYLPHRVTADCVIYTGTHDNDTTAGLVGTAWASTSAMPFEPTSDRAPMALTGASSAWRKVRSPVCRWSRCRMFLVWAAKPA